MSDPIGLPGPATSPMGSGGFFFAAFAPATPSAPVTSSAATAPVTTPPATTVPTSSTAPATPAFTLPGSAKSRFDEYGLVTAAEDQTLTFAADGTEARNRNSVAAYRVDPRTGTIDKTVMLTADAHGGYKPLVMAKGETWGFTVLPDGKRLGVDDGGGYAIRRADGSAPSLFDGKADAKLVKLDANGNAAKTFDGLMFGAKAENADGLLRSKQTIDANGRVTIGFEDQKGLGDKDYDDARFSFTLSPANAAATNDATQPQASVAPAQGFDLRPLLQLIGLAYLFNQFRSQPQPFTNPDPYAWTTQPARDASVAPPPQPPQSPWQNLFAMFAFWR